MENELTGGRMEPVAEVLESAGGGRSGPQQEPVQYPVPAWAGDSENPLAKAGGGSFLFRWDERWLKPATYQEYLACGWVRAMMHYNLQNLERAREAGRPRYAHWVPASAEEYERGELDGRIGVRPVAAGGKQEQQPALSPEEFLEVFLPLWHAYKQAGPPAATVVSYYEVLKGVPRDVLERRSLEWRKTGKKMPTAAEWMGKA